MPDVIGTHVSASLSSFHSAIQSAFRGLHEETVRAARIAHAEAEAAFSHPAILPQLSFPESHKVRSHLCAGLTYDELMHRCLRRV